jgi:membrane protein YqaA with SNARE-associated domain
MEKLIVGMIVAAGMPALLVLLALLGTIFGAIGGWIVGLFFDETLAKLAMAIGLEGTPAWQLGAMLGFVGGFFKSSNANNCNN